MFRNVTSVNGEAAPVHSRNHLSVFIREPAAWLPAALSGVTDDGDAEREQQPPAVQESFPDNDWGARLCLPTRLPRQKVDS